MAHALHDGLKLQAVSHRGEQDATSGKRTPLRSVRVVVVEMLPPLVERPAYCGKSVFRAWLLGDALDRMLLLIRLVSS